MSKIRITYTIDLNENEASALKRLLGSMNDKQFAEFGIKGDDRQAMSDIWNLLPYDDDE
ncbi:hypothetical protein [uncultured Paraglaciecola sp.]|uniref:hypothetical protein n=1 Tax=uncultured Paraglaciecola sp. TaxID=1765024 RepID=UPI002633C7CC|nr:hypothetical protein [uncultured Paraglaciecola sp.]